MERSTNLTITTIIISAILFLFAYFFYNNILDFILPDVPRGIYQATADGSELKISLLFCFTISLIPFFVSGAWVFSPIVSANNRLLSALVILLCVILAIWFRRQSIKDDLAMLSGSTGFNILYPFEQVNFEYYILGGLCVGFIISYSLFREKKK